MAALLTTMKVLTFISLFLAKLCLAQVPTRSETVMDDKGKQEFILQAQKDTPDYSTAFKLLSAQVKQHPQNAEYRYFLAYTMDRMNAEDAKTMYRLQKEMTMKVSEQLEEVNRLEPVYQGELFLLDPYSKLSSIWGSLAQAYLNRNERDSAKWAFQVGKQRGGFTEAVLSFNRQLLNSCDKNAILITSGDNITISAWYLQLIENYRTDITVVDAHMFNTDWYPKYLKADRNLKLSYTDADLDTISYREWQSQTITIINQVDSSQKFSWQLQPTYMDDYLLRGDIILLDMVKQNLFTRPIYFNNNSGSAYSLFLTSYLQDDGLVNKLTTDIKKDTGFSKNLSNYNMDGIHQNDIIKSSDARMVLNGFRWAYFNNIYRLYTQGQYEKAKDVLLLMDTKFKQEKLPFSSAEMENYFINFFKQVKKK